MTRLQNNVTFNWLQRLLTPTPPHCSSITFPSLYPVVVEEHLQPSFIGLRQGIHSGQVNSPSFTLTFPPRSNLESPMHVFGGRGNWSNCRKYRKKWRLARLEIWKLVVKPSRWDHFRGLMTTENNSSSKPSSSFLGFSIRYSAF